MSGGPRLTRRELHAGALAGLAWALGAAPGVRAAARPDLGRRLGVDLRAQKPLLGGVEWAIANGVHFLENVTEHVPGALVDFPEEEAERIRALCQTHDVHLGIHSSSAVNAAEMHPSLSAAVDAYLEGTVRLASRLGAEWVVVHGGYHFTDDYEHRRHAALERLRRAVGWAEAAGVTLLLENHNPEPATAEIRYLAHSIEECRFFLDAIDSPRLRWAFNANHAHLTPDGIDGFLDAFGVERIGEIRLADNIGEREVHLQPGEGNIDFAALFRRVEAAGYSGPYVLAFGDLDDVLRGRAYLLDRAGTDA